MKQTKNVLAICGTALLVTFCITADVQARLGKSETSTTAKYTIENCINKFSIDRAEETKAGFQYWFADPIFADGKSLKLSVVAPHSAPHPPHMHAEDEFFFILEGKAEVYLRGQWTPIGPYTSFYAPPNLEHGIRNAGDIPLKYLVIKKYDASNPVRKEFLKNRGYDK